MGSTLKHLLRRLVISLACLVVALAGLAFLFPIQPAGLVPPGSGVYIGDGIMLSNQHIAAYVSEESSFLVPGWKYLWHTLDVDVEEVVFVDRDLELAVIKLQPSMLNVVRVVTPCLSTRSVKQGETLRVTSSPGGKFPPVSAALVVSDARPLMRLNPSPSDGNPYSAMTVIATLSADQAALVGKGSSGGPVLNDDGELVGLVWTGRVVGGGAKEIWITPVSAWLSQPQLAEMQKDVLRHLSCGSERGLPA